MANFDTAYDITMAHEGGYDNNPNDVGGETYKGISRKFHPYWPGWDIIDAAKDLPDFPNSLYTNETLDKLTREFFKTNFWDIVRGDEIPSQIIANELFDTGVNMNHIRAVLFLQKALNVLNKNGKLYADISTDGRFGNGTLSALESCLDLGGESILYKIINVLQGNHYIEYMMKNPAQEMFARGWFARVDFVKQKEIKSDE